MAREILQTDNTFDVCETELEDVECPDPDVVYTLRYVTTHKVQEVQRRFPRENQGYLVQNTLFDYALVDWRGITLNGQPLPCEMRYKLALPSDVISAITSLVRKGKRNAADRDASFRPTETVG